MTALTEAGRTRETGERQGDGGVVRHGAAGLTGSGSPASTPHDRVSQFATGPGLLVGDDLEALWKDRLRMPSTAKKTPATSTWARRLMVTAVALVSATTLVVSSADSAQAHHGWDDFDTDRLYYVAGTVSEVRWGEPHSFFTVTLDDELPADTPDLDLPEELRAPEDSGPIDVAPSYSGNHDALDVVIAPPSFTGRWGLDRPLRDGEQVELVGYVGRSHDDEFRPVAFWYDEGTPVNQVLGSELPATPLPVPYPEAEGARDGSASAVESDDASATVVWAGLGVVLVAVVAGGAVYLRSRRA